MKNYRFNFQNGTEEQHIALENDEAAKLRAQTLMTKYNADQCLVVETKPRNWDRKPTAKRLIGVIARS